MATKKTAKDRGRSTAPPATDRPRSGASADDTPEAVEVIVQLPFRGPDAPDGAVAGDRLTVSPDRHALLLSLNLVRKAPTQ